MRKTVLVLASVALAMLLVSGVALAANVIRCERGSTQNNPCHGTKNPDILRGTIGRDHIIGWSLRGGYFSGPKDNDTIYGKAKNDVIDGGNGKDRLYGGSGADDIYGGSKFNKIYGGDGDDYLDNNVPYDRDPGSAWMSGGTGNDELVVGDGNDTLYGGRGADFLRGWSGVDHLYGQAGPDLIYSHDGSDPISYDELDEKDFVTCGDGVDEVHADNPGVDVIAADCERVLYETPE